MSYEYGIIKEPVSTDDVCTALGVSDHDIGNLCVSPNINIWSFYKPVSFNSPYMLTEADFFSIDDGFTISHYNYPSEIIRALAGGKGWVYNKPSDWYRLTDFVGYDVNAKPWFTLVVEGLNYGAPGDTIRFSMPTTLDWIVDNFKAFEELASQIQGGAIDVGFIITSRWSSDVAIKGTYYYKIADYLDFRDEPEKKLNIEIPTSTSDIPDGSYYVVPTITTDTNHAIGRIVYISENSSMSTTWYTIPANPVTIIIDKDRPQFQPLDYLYFEYSNITYDEGQDTYPPYDYYKDVSFTVKCGFRSDYNGSSGRLVVEYIVENVYGGTGTSTYDKTIGSLSGDPAGKGWSTTRYISSGKMSFLTSKEDGYIAVLVRVSFTIAARIYKKEFNITLP